jgi:hypothetical protein
MIFDICYFGVVVITVRQIANIKYQAANIKLPDIAIELEFNHNHRQPRSYLLLRGSGWLRRLSTQSRWSTDLVYGGRDRIQNLRIREE